MSRQLSLFLQASLRGDFPLLPHLGTPCLFFFYHAPLAYTEPRCPWLSVRRACGFLPHFFFFDYLIDHGSSFAAFTISYPRLGFFQFLRPILAWHSGSSRDHLWFSACARDLCPYLLLLCGSGDEVTANSEASFCHQSTISTRLVGLYYY